MRIDIMTLFPDMCGTVLGESIIGRARSAHLVEINCHNIRDYTDDKHNRVDDYTYGGGAGMIMQPEPIYNCFKAVCEQTGTRPHCIYMTPQGHTFMQSDAVRLSKLSNVAILCGHYEGVDQRLIDEIVDEELSVGDFVVTGGELPALIVADAISRLLPGVLSGDECFERESHYSGLLEYPQYTRPPEFMGRKVPEVLLNGNAESIEAWRHMQSLKVTLEKRPELLEKLKDSLPKEDMSLIEALKKNPEGGYYRRNSSV